MSNAFDRIRLTSILLAAALVGFPSASRAQEKDPAKLLGQTHADGSLPIWSKPTADARKVLGQIARTAEGGVFLVGYRKKTETGTIWGTGTAWVISKKNRLLVTNAHVADMFHESGGKLMAIPSGTAQLYRVEKVWYHPGVRRFSKKAAWQSVRSTDPAEGPVDSKSPDLALLQLSADGPELKVEFAPATAEELAELFAHPAAIMGFPSHDTESWPALGDSTAATFHDGVISRLTDFLNNSGGSHAEKQFVQYTMATWPGFSGSPVFLPNGHVCAVHNSAAPVEGRFGNVITIPHGIRIDCVAEMLVHHGLDEKAPFKIDKAKVLVERWLKPDPRSEKALANMAKASELIWEAHGHRRQSQFKKAMEKCEAAMKVLPSYSAAYSMRAIAIHAWWVVAHDVEPHERLRLLKLALGDAQKAAKMEPSDLRQVIHVCRVLQGIAWETKDKELYAQTAATMTKFLESDNLPTADVKAEAYGVRGYAYHKLGHADAALRDYNEAVRLRPETVEMYDLRASFWDDRGRPDLAAPDHAKAKKLREGDVQVEYRGQWFPATVLKKEGVRYHIHYLGSDSKWDEWVPKERVRTPMR